MCDGWVVVRDENTRTPIANKCEDEQLRPPHLWGRVLYICCMTSGAARQTVEDQVGGSQEVETVFAADAVEIKQNMQRKSVDGAPEQISIARIGNLFH